MKTLNQNLKKIIGLMIAGLFAISVDAQINNEKEYGIINLDTLSVVSNKQAFKGMVSKIISNKKFKYRKTLKHSKAVNKEYDFSNISISEVEILKHFKKAARKSDSVEEFISYFHERNLDFLKVLDGSVISNLYFTIRQTTLNGHLDEWESAFGSNY
tara:strand:+ start:112 stop:582 length:471 start_codon:yes stop_codon:yes gene_type:complete